MSFLIKCSDKEFVVSIVSAGEDNYTVFATNFKEFFIEKSVTNEILENRLSDQNEVRFPIKKVIKALLEGSPSCSSLEITEDKMQMKMELVLTIKIDNFKSEKLKLNFNLNACTTIEEVSTFFLAGMMKSLMENVSCNKVHLSQPSFKISDDVLKKQSSIVALLNGTIEKDVEQEMLKKKETESALRKKGIKTKTQNQSTLKSQMMVLEEKAFEFDDNCSQEIEEETEIAVPSSLPSSSSVIPNKKQKRKQVKF